MASEFGSGNYQNDSGYSNTGKAQDNRAQGANPSAREFQDYSAQNETSTGKAGGSRRTLLRSLTTAAAAAVAATTILPTVLSPSLTVRFEYLNATDTVLEYVLSLENFGEDDEVSVLIVLPNGYTVNEQRAEAEIVSGTVTGLSAGTRYDVVVKNGGSEVTSRSVTMAKKRITALRSVTHECRCAVDGTFHFRLDFVDENAYWSQFHATLTDSYGTVSECDFSDAPTEEHTLAVNDAGMRGNRAVLKIVCLTTEPDESGQTAPRETVLYESEVAI